MEHLATERGNSASFKEAAPSHEHVFCVSCIISSKWDSSFFLYHVEMHVLRLYHSVDKFTKRNRRVNFRGIIFTTTKFLAGASNPGKATWNCFGY
jgi:hypothetical protein